MPNRAAAITLGAILLTACAPDRDAGPSLEEGFRNPPSTARPAVYYLLLNGYVNAEHVNRELAAFHDAGIGGLCVFDMGARGDERFIPPAGPPFLSDASVDSIAHIVRTAGRLGLEVDLSVSSSWDMGGSWVEPRDGSMALYHTELTVEGPSELDAALPFPSVPEEVPKGPDGLPAFRTEVAVLAVPAEERQPGHEIIIKLEKPERIGRFVLYNTAGGEPAKDFSIAVSTTSPRPSDFREVLRGSLQPGEGAQSFPIGPTDALYVRLLVLNSHYPGSDRVQLAEIEGYTPAGRNVMLTHRARRTIDGAGVIRFSSSLGPDRGPWSVYNLIDGVTSGARGSWSSAGPPPWRIPDRSRIVDLTSRLTPASRLQWSVPEGRWAILRFVCANTGERLKVPSPNSDGFATDHLSAGATRRFLTHLIDRLHPAIGDLGQSALDDLYLASYEVRGRIWTPDLASQFKRRRGYDLTPFLPALYGAIVDDEETTERFRYDFRKTLGEILVDAYYHTAAEVAHSAGLGVESEAGGPGPPIHQVPVDSLLALGAVDSVRGEFWPHRPLARSMWVVKETATAAHIYGKRRIHMEAFTSTYHWQDSPQDLKPAADRAFGEGMNHVVWHTASHQPPEAGRPGWVYGAGTHLTPNLVWWPMAKPFLDYLARTSFLLQQGLFVGDVVYYYGDQGYNFVMPKHAIPGLGPGYDYDVTNRDVILKRMSVRDGRITLPDGMSYAVLALPDRDDIDLDVLRKIEELVEAGATVVGPKPARSTGLTGYPERDRAVSDIAGRLWGPAGPISPRSPRDVLAEHGIGPDFEFESQRPDTDLDFIHRRTPDADIYFISNKLDRSEPVEAIFRVTGRTPEIWRPDTGEIHRPVSFETTAGTTRIPLTLDPHGSLFVVFRSTTSAAPPAPAAPPPVAVSIDGPWEVTFPEGLGAPASAPFPELISWTEHDHPGVRCFSGIATYHTAFEVPAGWSAGGRPAYLDLGRLWAVGRVLLNGKDLGVVWKKPFRVNAAALRPGQNQLEIQIANTWANRLSGEARGECSPKLTRTNITASGGTPWAKVKPMPSGLFGPVTLLATGY